MNSASRPSAQADTPNTTPDAGPYVAPPAASAPAPDDTAVPVVRSMPWLAIALIALWVGLEVATGRGQWGDHFEQFVWAHGAEWGYYKHPPLPTWMLASVIFLFGPSVFWAQAIAFACTAGTACFTWAIARRLLGADIAALALLLWGLQQAFSLRAGLFNHNTVMMLGVSAAGFYLLRACDSARDGRGALAWWLAAGCAAGLAMLAKYQAVLGLGGLLVAAALGGDLASRRARRGCGIAVAMSLLVMLPHIAWLLQRHATAFDYALQAGRSLDLVERLRNLLSFSVQQLRQLMPSLLFAGALLIDAARRGKSVAGRPVAGRPGAPDGRRRRAWLFGLIGFPLAATLLSSPLLGLELQNHWGYQALQFVSLWLAWRLRRRVPAAGPIWFAMAMLMHAVFIALAFLVAPVSTLSSQGQPTRRLDRAYPAQQLADAVLRDWHAITPCPLAYVVGPSFEAGMVSVYAGGRAAVLEDGDIAKSPWIDAADLQRRGAAYIAIDPGDLPSAGAMRTGSLDVQAVSPPPSQRVWWALVPPVDCAEADPSAPTPAPAKPR